MSNRHDSKDDRYAAAPAAPGGSTTSAQSGAARGARRHSVRLLLAVAIGLLLVAIAYFSVAPPPAPAGAPDVQASRTTAAMAKPMPPQYVGAAACAGCHPKEQAAWQGSQHDRAMAVASESTVLGNFAGAKFSHGGVTSTFFRRDGRYFVNTDGPDGKLADFEVRYTFGVEPLQQYLVDFPGGRLQALGIAWDTRPKAQGGQRWFHLYPDRRLSPGEPLHWTGIDQTWNYQCADCHSTNLRKHYDEKSNTYATSWTDINVGCEACHGPGSRHLAWAGKKGNWQQDAASKGLTVQLDERRGVAWAIDSASGNAVRSRPRDSSREIETCARCHARRGQFSDAWHAGDRFADGFRASLIEPGLYHGDGQQRDEVYVVGSFLASRMHMAGVTCSDCHEPHSGRLRGEGNAVCSQCHAAAKYDAAAHHHHPPGSRGAQCTACHMPTTTYMVVDPRHDHGFRIPRPDRSVSLGLPNACNQCHRDRSPQWAASALKSWFPQPKAGHQIFAEAFAAATQGAPGARQALLAVAEAPDQSAFVRASALERLGGVENRRTLAAVQRALADPDPLLRHAAVTVLGASDAGMRLQLLPPLLDDPVRQVRMAAARALAGEAEARLPPASAAAFRAALDEYIAAERFNADRPESRANLGNLHALQGRADEAAAAYRSALELDPSFVQAAINLADLRRQLGAEAEAESILRDALRRDPRSAAVHHALGLSLWRQKRAAEAMKELAEAARLDPASARFGYVYAVALHGAGDIAGARRELERGLKRHPNDRDLLQAAAMFERDAGRRDRALALAQRLAELEPDRADVARLVQELGGR